jgi:predicted nuclease with TOPRIM domain
MTYCNNSEKRIIRYNPKKFVGRIEDLHKFKKSLKECKEEFDNLYNNITENLDLIYKDRERKILSLKQRSDKMSDIERKWGVFKNKMEDAEYEIYGVWDNDLAKEIGLNVVLEYVE